PGKVSGLVELHKIFRLRRLIIGSRGFLHSGSDTKIPRAALIHYGCRQTGKCAVNYIRLAVWRERKHRLYAAHLPVRPCTGQSKHCVPTQGVPGETQAGHVRPEAKSIVPLDSADQTTNVIAAVEICFVRPSVRVAKRDFRLGEPAAFSVIASDIA